MLRWASGKIEQSCELTTTSFHSDLGFSNPFQDVKDALLNSGALPDLGLYDFMCKMMEGARKEFPVAFATGGRVPCSQDGQPLPLPHLEHISPAFGKSRANPAPSSPPRNPLDLLTSDQIEHAEDVPSETDETALRMARGATEDKQTIGFAELLVTEALYPAAWKLTTPVLFKPPRSSRSVLKDGPLLPDGSRRPHPYTGNTQETLGLTSASHIANHVGPCRQERDPLLLREQLAGMNLEGPEQTWSQDARHLPSHTGMNLPMFSFALRFRTHKTNVERNEKIKENLLRAAKRGDGANRGGFEIGADEFGRFKVVRRAADSHAAGGAPGGSSGGGPTPPESRQQGMGGEQPHREKPTVSIQLKLTSPSEFEQPWSVVSFRRLIL